MKVKRFALFVFLLIIFIFNSSKVFSQQDDYWYEGKPIRNIVFSGLQNINESELEALMNQYRGLFFTDDVYSEILGKLYALEYFDNIEPSTVRANPEGTEVILRFTVIERPIVRRINFIGNSGLRDRELNDTITTKVNDIFNQTRLRADLEAIRLKYLEKGYPDVSVTVDESYTQDGVTINFRIIESERISIIRIDFQGNTRFTANTLRGQLSLKARSLLNDGAFNEAKLIQDREAIVKYYQDRGYIDAAVRDVTRTYGQDNRGTNLVLTFMIDEGEQYTFGGVNFEGNVIFSTEQLTRLISSRVGDIVNLSRIEMDLQRVVNLYMENGYFSNSLVRSVERDTQNLTISFTMSIVERNRAYIENIRIVGNDKTRDYVILREIPLEPGDVFSSTKIIDAMRNLYNLQYFSIVYPDTSPGSEENLIDLIFVVEEAQTTSIQFGVTFSGSPDPDAFPISGMLEWTDSNLAGTGNQLGIKISSSIETFQSSVNYLHRWIFGLPLSLGADFSANYSRRYTPMDSTGRNISDSDPFAFPNGFGSYEEYAVGNQTTSKDFQMPYDQWYLSLGLSTGYRWLTPAGIIGLNGGLRFGFINNSFEDGVPFDLTLRGQNGIWVLKNSISLAFSLDQRDIFYDPSRGYYFNQRIGLYGFFNNEFEHYIRTESKLEYYHTLFNIAVKWSENWSFKCVLAMHAGISFILPHPWNPLVIENANKLAVDGMFIGRGWTDVYHNKGYMLLDSWIELRFPVINGILALDLFLDMAGVEKQEGNYFSNGNFDINDLRFSFGGGLRFTLPQFPIRLSFAKRFSWEDNNFKWGTGSLFNRNLTPGRGLDLVISFALSY